MNVLENVKSREVGGHEGHEGGLDQSSFFSDESSVHFGKRGLASAVAFTSSNSGLSGESQPQKDDKKADDDDNLDDRYVEITRQRPRQKLDLNYIKKMMSSENRVSSTHEIQNEPNSQLRTMVAEMVSKPSFLRHFIKYSADKYFFNYSQKIDKNSNILQIGELFKCTKKGIFICS